MKKTQFTDFITTVKNTAVSYIAIAVFVALGLAFYGGTAWSAAHTEKSFTRAYGEGHMEALLITDPLGMTEEQIASLKEVEGVDAAEGLNTVYRFFDTPTGIRQLAAVTQMTENADILLHVEGRLPSAAGEVAVLRCWSNDNGIFIGDSITLSDENGSDYRSMQSVRQVAQWDGEDITALSVSAEDPGYLVSNTLTVTAIVDSPVYLSTNPYVHGMCGANGLYIDAIFFVSKEEMPPEVFGGYTSAVVYSEELNSLPTFGDSYKAKAQSLGDTVKPIVDGWDKQLVEDFGKATDTLREQLDALAAMTGVPSPEGEALYEALTDMRDSLTGQQSFCAVQSADTNATFLFAENLISILDSIRSVLGVTFLVIGALICYSAVSRLVADGAVQIGTKKALGFRPWEILRLYLLYVGSAMLLGGILGVLIGVFGVERAFVGVLADQFSFVSLPLVWDLTAVLPAFGIICGILFGVTAVVCYGETQRPTVDLLRGTRSLRGGSRLLRNTGLLKKLSLLNQTVLQNLFTDGRRVFGMLTGIAGVAALAVAGLSLYVQFDTAFTKQFEVYYRFDYHICYDGSSPTAAEEIRAVLDRYGLDYAELYSSSCILHTPDGNTNAPYVLVPTDTEALGELLRFDTDTDTDVPYSGGVWMSAYYRYAFDAPVGSLIRLETLDGKEASLPVEHYYAYHLSTPAVFMDADTYFDAFGAEASPNSFFVASAGCDWDQVNAALNAVDGYIYSYNYYESFLSGYDSEKAVMLAFASLFTVMAVLMALMTLINLLNVYISEKKTELIVLMINGYDRRYVKRYIYFDTVILTFTGIVIGLIVGSFLGDRTLTAIEGTSIRFIHGVCAIACGVSALGTALLTAIICVGAMGRIDRFRLSDIDTGY